MEFNSSKQLEFLTDLSKQVRWINNSVSQGLVHSILQDPKFDDPLRLERFGACAASQNEEDGMLAEIFRRIGTTSRTFFEFGVGNGLQNITLAALLQGWSGAWIEINLPKAQFIRERFADAIRAGKLVLGTTAVNAENINQISKELKVPDEIDLMSIDIDGNDYHVFKAMDRVRARVLVMEYNPLYPPPMRVVMAYDRNYAYNDNTYVGASLQSVTELAEAKGYRLVACSISGVNAVFVRSDLAAGKFAEPATPAHLFHTARFQLSYSGGFGAGHKSNINKFEEPKW